jgi:hypothetical protein
MLDNEKVLALRKELPLESGHSLRVKQTANNDSWARWLVYTEEDPVSERLDTIDPNWTFEIRDKVINGNAATVYARLTVCGVARDCVGEGKSGNPGDAQKGAATDALKRGARLFGVGRYLKKAPLFFTDWEKEPDFKKQQEYEQKAFVKFAAWYRSEFGNVVVPSTPVRQKSDNNRTEGTPEAAQEVAGGSPANDNGADGETVAESELDAYFGPKMTPAQILAGDTFPFDAGWKGKDFQKLIKTVPHWNNVFWPVVSDLGLTDLEVHKAAQVESIKDYKGKAGQLWLDICEYKLAQTAKASE